jgi:hypothetical protein
MRTTRRATMLVGIAMLSSRATFGGDNRSSGSGGRLLNNQDYGVEYNSRGPTFEILLRKVAERNEAKVLRWVTLDKVTGKLGSRQFVCLTPWPVPTGTEQVGIAVADKEHKHSVLRSWVIDFQAARFVPSRLSGARCSLDECGDEVHP